MPKIQKRDERPNLVVATSTVRDEENCFRPQPCSESPLTLRTAVAGLLSALGLSGPSPGLPVILIVNSESAIESFATLQNTGIAVVSCLPADPPSASSRPFSGERLPFRDFVREHFEPGVIRHLQSGKHHYRYLLRKYVLPELGMRPLTSIGFNDVQALLHRFIDAGYSVETARHVRVVISCVFKHAIRTGHFRDVLPTFGIRLPARRPGVRHALTIDQAKAVLAELKTPCREMALLSMTTSMNLAELCALRWKRVNLTDQSIIMDGELLPAFSIAIRESFYQGEFGNPKTANRRRILPVPQITVAALKQFYDTAKFQKPEDIVFATRNGTPKGAANLRFKIIKPVGARLGLPWLNFHVFRRTFATIGEQLGVPLSDRQAQMGHGGVWMTQEYTVSNIDQRRAAMEKIAEALT
jgi:integrase